MTTLAACATTGKLDPAEQRRAEARWQKHAAQLAQIDRFTLIGRAASGLLGFKADLRWKSFPDGRFSLRMSGPLGAGAALLEGDAQQVQIRTAEGQAYTTDPEAWLAARFGSPVPVTGLRWWALGLPSPHAPYDLELDAQGRAALITQNGWELAYSEYAQVQGFELPSRIEARNGETALRLFADRWDDLGPARP